MCLLRLFGHVHENIHFNLGCGEYLVRFKKKWSVELILRIWGALEVTSLCRSTKACATHTEARLLPKFSPFYLNLSSQWSHVQWLWMKNALLCTLPSSEFQNALAKRLFFFLRWLTSGETHSISKLRKKIMMMWLTLVNKLFYCVEVVKNRKSPVQLCGLYIGCVCICNLVSE